MPIAIAGMHRSGSSLIARLLNLCGLDLGPADQLMPPAPDNPEGFWENLSFVHVNENIIGQLGGRWDQPSQPLPGWESLSLLNPWRDMARGLPELLKLQEPWGWKDPRNSITLPFWRSLWPDVKVVVCVRNPLEVANSLLERDQFRLREALMLWREYYERLLNSADHKSIVVTHFDAYFVDPITELTRMLQYLRLPADGDKIRSATRAVIGELRHSRLGPDELTHAGIPDEVRSVYFQLCTLGGPVMSRSMAEPARPRRDYANAVRQALELEAKCLSQQRRIRELEIQLRITQISRDENKQWAERAEQTACRVGALEQRLAARRHRYADQLAETLLRAAKPLRRATEIRQQAE